MSDERMREALEESAWAIQELLALIHGECPGILDSDRGGSWAQVERIDKALASAMEALSPPARRTSYEWEAPDKSRWKVEQARSRWDTLAEVRQYGRKKWISQSYVPGEVCAAAIATLAGLEKEEE